jgi:predicted RNA binding protein with dsRBD fold (UPF0201 family)
MEVRTEINPTEDRDRVIQAMLALFPDIEVEIAEDYLTGTTDSLDTFKMAIRKQRILDATRGALYHGMSGDHIVLHLNKQVALMGKVSFVEGDPPLGAIVVRIESEDIETLIDHVAPRTENGEIQ